MWCELPDEATFNFVNSEIQRLLENEPMTVWANKLFGNGEGGYYMPLPTGRRLVEGIEDLVADYPQYDTLPSTAPPGSHTSLSITDDLEYAAEDFTALGKVAEGLIVSEINLLVKPNGDRFLIAIYRSGTIVIVNCQDHNYNVINWLFKPWKAIYHETTNSIIFFSSVGLNILRYSLTSETVEFETEDGELTSDNEHDGIIDRCLGTDDCIYFGSTLSASVWKYDPSTDTITDFGAVFEVTASTYVYHIAADNTHVYCGLRSGGKYWLVVLDQSTLETEVYGEDDNYEGMSITLYDSESGPFVRVNLSRSDTAPNLGKSFRNGVGVSDTQTDNLDYTIREGRLDAAARNPESWPETFNFEIDGLHLSGLNEAPMIRYRETGAETFTSVTFEGITKENFNSIVFKAVGTKIYGAFAAYAPIFIFDTSDDSVEFLEGYPGISVYDVFPFSDQKIYLSGYANDTREWDREDPWNHGNEIETSEASNPQRLGLGLSNAYYHYFITKSGDYIYVFWERTRNDTGSGVSWYNTVTKEIGHSDDAMIAYLKNYNVSHMLTINNGDTLILMTAPRGTATFPRIFIFDISTEKNLNLITPVTKDIPLLNTPAGIGFDGGANVLIGFTKNKVYKLDLTDINNEIIRQLPSAMSPLKHSACVAQKSDGSIWFLGRPSSETYLYELDPTTFTAVRRSSNLGTDAYNRSITITSSDKLYLFGGKTSIGQFEGENSQYFIESLEL